MPNRLVNQAGFGSDFRQRWKICSKDRDMPDEIDLGPGDRAIIRALQQDCRLSNAQLAEKVGMSASACWRRVISWAMRPWVLSPVLKGLFVAAPPFIWPWLKC